MAVEGDLEIPFLSRSRINGVVVIVLQMLFVIFGVREGPQPFGRQGILRIPCLWLKNPQLKCLTPLINNSTIFSFENNPLDLAEYRKRKSAFLRIALSTIFAHNFFLIPPNDAFYSLKERAALFSVFWFGIRTFFHLSREALHWFNLPYFFLKYHKLNIKPSTGRSLSRVYAFKKRFHCHFRACKHSTKLGMRSFPKVVRGSPQLDLWINLSSNSKDCSLAADASYIRPCNPFPSNICRAPQHQPISTLNPELRYIFSVHHCNPTHCTTIS